MSIDLQRTQALFRRMEQILSKTRSKPLPERVHQVRTTARRLEALLETLYPDPDRGMRRLMKRLTRLRRRAGGVRDVDVQIVALRKLKIGREDQRKARLMQALGEMRAGQEERLLARLSTSRIRKLRKALRRTLAEIIPAVGPVAAPEQPPAPAATAEAAAREAVRAEQVVAPAAAVRQPPAHPVELALRMFARAARRHGALTPDNIHPYRTEGKRVRYVAEMAGAVPEAEHMVKLLKRQQDSAGDWHDWFTLTQTAESVFARAHDSGLLAALRNVTNAKFVEARKVCLDVRRELLSRHRSMLKAKREAAAEKRRAAARQAARTRARRRAARAAAKATVPRHAPAVVEPVTNSGAA